MTTKVRRLAPRRVAWSLSVLMSLVVAVAVVVACWLLDIEIVLTLLLGALGFVTSLAVIGSTLLLITWWISSTSQSFGFPHIQFESGPAPATISSAGSSGRAEHFVVLNEVRVSSASDRSIELRLRMRVYYSDDEYMIWWASHAPLPAWEGGRQALGFSATEPLTLPMVLSPGHGTASGYVGFRMEDHADALQLLRSNRHRLRFLLEVTDRESRVVRATDLGAVELRI